MGLGGPSRAELDALKYELERTQRALADSESAMADKSRQKLIERAERAEAALREANERLQVLIDLNERDSHRRHHAEGEKGRNL